MNSSKKGAAYGFRLNSLDNLYITKSSDKKSTIVNYIVDVVSANYPELRSFDVELKYIDKAAQFSLENILTDVSELEKGMALTQKELQARQLALQQQENNNENESVSSSGGNNISMKNAVNNKKKQALLISDELRTRNRKPMINPDEVKVRI